MSDFARVVVQAVPDREFDYRIPPGLKDTVRLGSKVVVPFGRTMTTGYVVGLTGKSERPDLKEIVSVAGDRPILTEPLVELGRWIADYYCAPVEQAMRAMIPGPVRKRNTAYRELLFAVPVTDPDAEVEAATRKRAPAQATLLDELRRSGGSFIADLEGSVAGAGAAAKALEKKGLITTEKRQNSDGVEFASSRSVLRTQGLPLMPDQERALADVKRSIETLAPPVILLHGVTGSGKTEVYLQAIEHVLSLGKGAIVLVPEISLTPQTVERFVGRFGDSVGVLHSHLTESERRAEWHRIREGGFRIAVGARSAVFAPVENLGLIVVDEEHDTSYKQDETPRYNARDVAVMRGRLEKCAVLLGSATPSAESNHNATTGKYARTVLPCRVDHRTMPVMRVVDMRVEAAREGRANVFSRDLVEAVKLRLSRGEQSILFLNRRGYSTSIICPKCGFVERCNLCSIAMTYHKHTENLLCHVCGAVRKVPASCPKCHDPAFRYSGIGTQRVEKIVEKVFPSARVARMDSDVTGERGVHQRMFDEFRTGRIDVLVGTQMIAKGLDFPNVTLIGVICADLSLHMPDFRAAERTFQLVVQVAGRAGRGDVPGEVIIQTYTPNHPAIELARQLDYDGFQRQEEEFRRELKYPPFAHLVCIKAKGLVEAQVSYAIKAFAKELARKLPASVVVSGPAPAPLARAKGHYRYHMVLRSGSVRTMTCAIRSAMTGFKWPPKVSCSVDVDAISLG